MSDDMAEDSLLSHEVLFVSIMLKLYIKYKNSVLLRVKTAREVKMLFILMEKVEFLEETNMLEKI